jgi:hypothetical protein
MAFHLAPACIFASGCLGLAILSYFHLQRPHNLLWYSQTGAIILLEWVGNKNLAGCCTWPSGMPRNILVALFCYMRAATVSHHIHK